MKSSLWVLGLRLLPYAVAKQEQTLEGVPSFVEVAMLTGVGLQQSAFLVADGVVHDDVDHQTLRNEEASQPMSASWERY
jgi:hypothetical protein